MNTIHWTDADDERRTARWYTQNATPPPKRVITAGARISVAAAYRHVSEGTALLWQGDYPSARRLLTSLRRKLDGIAQPKSDSLAQAFHLQRREQARRSRVLGMLLIPYADDWAIGLRQAPDVREACVQAYGEWPGGDEPVVGSLRELLGIVGAYEWRRKGVEIPALGAGARIHPHYGVFSPVRGEYVDLVAKAPLPTGADSAFDIGTGTGVLAALLAHRGLRRVVATDLDPRAVACARDNAERLGLPVEVREADLYPAGRAHVVVCNPPWLPARPRTPLDHAVYDPGSRMLHSWLDGLADHLEPGGEGWLIISDLAERLGLRGPTELSDAIDKAGLRVVGRLDTRPRHGRAADRDDPLHEARAAELTTLWRLAPRAT